MKYINHLYFTDSVVAIAQLQEKNNKGDSSGYHANIPVSDISLSSSSHSPTPTTAAPSSIVSTADTTADNNKDFTTQAALSGLWARQTNNIVGAQSYYDIVFVTSTTGTIKFIDITFPPGTLIGAPPRLVEREGIGHGNAVKESSTKISYTVLNPVSVPAGTKIRLELFNLVNPTVPSTGYKVIVTTKDAGGTTIDGPTASNGLSMKQIGTEQIADGAITTPKIAPGAVTGDKIAGTDKLIFGICAGNLPAIPAGGSGGFSCTELNSISGDQMVAGWSNSRSGPSPVMVNFLAINGGVTFGFVNPHSVSTAPQQNVQISYMRIRTFTYKNPIIY